MERFSGAAPPPQSDADRGEPTGLRVRVEDSAGGGANGAPMATLIGVGSQVERIFKIAGVGEALSVFSDRGRALASLGTGCPAS